jgi:hypothetical protein
VRPVMAASLSSKRCASARVDTNMRPGYGRQDNLRQSLPGSSCLRWLYPQASGRPRGSQSLIQSQLA